MKVGMLTTIEADGSLRSRPLETVEFEPRRQNVKIGTLAAQNQR